MGLGLDVVLGNEGTCSKFYYKKEISEKYYTELRGRFIHIGLVVTLSIV